MIKFLSVLMLLTISNGWGITLKLNFSLAAELNSTIEQSVEQIQPQPCPPYRRCQEGGGSR